MNFPSTAAIGLILTALTLLQQIAFWQRKEYRWDRVWSEVRSSGRAWRLVWTLVGVVAIAASFGLGWVGLAAVAAWFGWQTMRRGWARPQATVKAAVVTLAAALMLGALFFSLSWSPAEQWLFLIILTPAAAAVAVLLGNLLGEVQKRRVIEQARQYRQQFQALTVVGITGSYGKTSTKYFLHHLLTGSGEEVCMSQARRNEAFVVAEDMLAHLTPATKTYLVEMAAYTSGEIERLARLTRPQIGVVTAIRNQHLALFGSLTKLAAAKWELIASLPPDGVAVLNADDPTIQTAAAGFAGRVIWYSTQRPVEVYADHITYEPTAFTATIHLKNESRTVRLPLAGEGYVSSVMAAAAAATATGLAPAAIFPRLASLQPVSQTMVVTTNSQGSHIIDDSYSANEDGVLMAIRHLTRFAQRHKMIVLRPLIELGDEAPRVQASIGVALAKANVEVFLYDTAGARDIEQTAVQAGLRQPVHRIAAPRQLARIVQQALSSDTACLLENRLPEIVRAAALA